MEYTTLEVISFLDENPHIEFISTALNGGEKILSIDNFGYLKCVQGEIPIAISTKDRWKVKAQKASVIEAINAYHNGKKIHCVCDTYKFDIGGAGYKLTGVSEELLVKFILKGEWYIDVL